MASCANFQSQLLDHLYELLDTAENRALQDHLSLCPDCQAALAAARGQQRLLAVAAKEAFPRVAFTPPPVGAVPREERIPVVATLRPRWVQWAAAAALVLFAVGLSAPVGIWAWKQRGLQLVADAAREEHLRAAKQAEQFDRSQADRRGQIKDSIAIVKDGYNQAQQRLANLTRGMQEQQLKLSVTGPAALQPGAPNHYQVQIQDIYNRPADAVLYAKVFDQERKVVHEVPTAAARGVLGFTLPAGVETRAKGNLALEIGARRPNGQPTQLITELPLAAPLYVTHLTTDKPMYQPGESVYFRSLTLERFSLKPPQDPFQVVYTVTSPLGTEVFRQQGTTLLTDPNRSDAALTLGPDGKPVRGVGAGEFAINPNLPGGEYTLTVAELSDRFPKQDRKFLVNKYQKDRLLKELDFNRKSYGPGDEVIAACKVKRAEGGAAVANQKVTAVVNVDGKTYGTDGKESSRPFELVTDAEGKVNVRFKLPTAIEQGRATLALVFTDGGSTEPLSKPIVIALKKLNVEFFPEGGDLIAGVPNRVYFQVRTTLDKPAELSGRIVDEAGNTLVERVETLHDDREPGVNQGMGAFTFTPKAGKKYELKIDTPHGLEGRPPLPDARAEGVVLHVPSSVVQPGDPLAVSVFDTQKGRTLLVGAYCRGRLIEHQLTTGQADVPSQLRFMLNDAPGGVYRVTVFEKRENALRPLAERLVYRQAKELLNLTVKPTQERYVPGEAVTLTVQAKNEQQAAAPAILMMAVVDKSVLTMADEKTHRSMPTHFFLTTEVRKPEDLEYADFLLGKHPKAAPALDLLLGTQGWRRFAEQDPTKFRKEQQAEADRLLVLMGQAAKPSGDLVQRDYQFAVAELSKQQQQFEERRVQAGKELAEVAQLDGNRLIYLEAQEASYKRYLAALEVINSHRNELARFRTVGLWLVLPLLLAGAGISLILAIVRNLPRAMPYYAISAACMLLILVGIGILQWSGLTDDSQSKAVASAVQPPRGLVRGDMASSITATNAPEDALFLQPGNDPKPTEGGKADGDGKGTAFPFGGMEKAPATRGPMDKPGAPPRPAATKPGQPDVAPALAPAAAGLQPADAPQAREDLFRGLRQAQAAEGAADKRKEFEALRDGDRQDNRARMRAEPVQPEREAARRALNAAPMADRAPELQGGGRGIARGGLAGAPGGGFGGAAGVGGPGGGFGGAARFGGAGSGPAQFGDAARAKMAEQAVLPPLVIREYAHRRQSSATPDVRRDFTETLFWHPVLVLPDGNGEVKFSLCDSVTTFQVAAVGHTLDGRLGAVTATVEARKPFTLEPRLPLEVTADDKIDVPVSVANNTNGQTTATIQVRADGLNQLKGQRLEELPLNADARKRLVYRFQPNLIEGPAQLYLEGGIPGFEGDKVLHTFQVVPQGFPVIGSRSDLLEKTAQETLELPAGWLKGTLKARVEVYPSTLADLQKGLAALLREPHGCFEQTSTSNYPNLLILDYLRETDQTLPEVEKRARDLLARGAQRLVSYECPYDGKGRHGFEWFGQQNHAHEALTAYGLMQFRDMARVQDVDPALIDRTRQWLLTRKDGKGGFQRNPRALDTFGRAPEDITNAYIVWALTESSKDDDVTKELDRLFEQAKPSKDPYFLSLVANSLLNRGRTEDGVSLLRRVAEAAKPDGHLDAATTSITGSGGRDLQIETTALAVYGWLKANRPADFNKPVQAAVKWIGQQRGGRGGFGSTQSTILALKALIAYAKANKQTPEAGTLTLFVGDQQVATQKFPAGASEALTLEFPEAEKHLKPGKNPVRVEITGKNVFPYTVSWSYQTLQPLSADKCPVKLQTHLAKTSLQEGESVRLTAKVENVSGKGQGMAVAILGLPAGLAVPEDMKQLKDYIRVPTDGSRPLLSAFEIKGRELILYWRDLAHSQKIEVPIDLVSRVPGEYSGPASRAYLYYNADHKHWVEPLKVGIVPTLE